MGEKILARASGVREVSPGDVVLAKLHVLSLLDGNHYDWLERQHLKVWAADRVIFCFDHFFDSSMPAPAATRHAKIREFARAQGIPSENVYDVGRHGLSHQVPMEEGWVLPGTFCATADTQGATMGALNCFSLPLVKSTAAALATGDVWVAVAETVKITLRGKLPAGVLGKDIYLRFLKDLREVTAGRVIEFGGSGVESLPIDVRMGVANGTNHLGAVTSIFPADPMLLDYVMPRAREAFEVATADPDATYVANHEYDLGGFEPLISGPHEIAHVRPLSQVQGTRVHAAYIGSCSGGRLEDLTIAARVLKGRRIHPELRMVITPISSRVMRAAAEDGLLATFAAAGATITSPGCGACFYGNQSPLRLADGEVCISASVENWPGRMGSDKADIYLGNAAVVAASAVEGRITDPRRYL